MPITKITPYTVDSTQNFTFNNVTATSTIISLNANLGNLVIANFFSGNGSLLTGISANAANSNYANFAGTVITAAQPNITSVGTLTSLAVTGNVSANFFIGNGSLLTGVPANTSLINGNSNIVVSANGNATVSITGNANVLVVTSTGINSAGYVNAVGNINGANITGTHYGAATGLTGIPGANVTGTVANATFATTSGSATSAATVTTNAQPNITSVGTLTVLTVSSGNLTANTGNVIFGNVGNVKITGGVANYVLKTDGTGNLNWVAQSGGGGTSNARVLGYSLIFGG